MKRRIALLLEYDDHRLRDFRRLLKAMLRGYGIRCLSMRPPEQTATFQSTNPSMPNETNSETTKP